MPKVRNLMLPGNPRSQPKELIPFFGYDNLCQPLIEVELAGLDVLAEIGMIRPEHYRVLTPQLRRRLLSIRTTEVDEVERKHTKHDIRALVRIMQETINRPVARWVHIPYTSYDALDTARTLLYVRSYRQALRPGLSEVGTLLIEKVNLAADQVQIGRTHGQHALPITVGFWLATILDRIVYNLQELDYRNSELRGKISGAVGAKNAQIGLQIEGRCGEITFEERVLGKLGLKPAPISTQILPPEPLAYYLHAVTMMTAAFGQLGRDCRNLMRSEIGEVVEVKDPGAVGSSTMAHKVNPINFEALEGEWLRTKNEHGKVLDSMISDHQRDLVASRLYRDFPIMLVNLQTQINILRNKNKQGVPFLRRVQIDRKACQHNFRKSANLILAEPIYIALIMAGHLGDTHALINDKLAPAAKAAKKPLIEILEAEARSDSDLAAAFERMPRQIRMLLRRPEQYLGNAAEQARKAVARAEAVVKTA